MNTPCTTSPIRLLLAGAILLLSAATVVRAQGTIDAKLIGARRGNSGGQG